jgi:MFS family permease
MVGVLTFPLSLLADRWGRVRSLTIMAVLWSAATLLCGLASGYRELMLGRLLVGIGEAAYGSVGIAVVLSVFPARLRATLTSAFMAGGLFGQVLGVGLGGVIAKNYGWRWAFVAIALAGLAIAAIYPLLVRETRVREIAHQDGTSPAPRGTRILQQLKSLFSSRAVVCAYIASGLQLYVAGAIMAWLPTYFGRYYGLAVDRAGEVTAVFLIVCGVGMILCGALSDRLAKVRPERKIGLAITCCSACAALLFVAFSLPPGLPQLLVLGAATFLAAGTTGPAGAMVANLTPEAIHGTAFATLTLANNLLGLALGPFLTGRFADMFGLLGALRLLPIACVLSALVFLVSRLSYRTDLSLATTAHGNP